jgi:hypothetical protein
MQMARNAHSTKAGPGRRHKDGTPHGRKPVDAKGAPRGFALHTNPLRNKERAIVAVIGARQFKKDRKAFLREQAQQAAS